MMIPEIGDTITPEHGAKLCRYFGLDETAERIEQNPQHYRPFVFDGASMLPDTLFSYIAGIPNLQIVTLKHDLKYAYGIPNDERARALADAEFYIDSLNDGGSPDACDAMFHAVRLFGKQYLRFDFSWAFANKR